MVGLALRMRRGEVLGLRWSDVDLENRTISIAQAVRPSGGKRVDGDGQKSNLHFVQPESFRGIRTIAMPEFVFKAIRAHKVRHVQERLASGSEWALSAFPFQS